MVQNKLKITRRGIGIAALYTAAFSALLLSLAFAFALLHPVDVIQDWKLTSDKQVYAPGQQIVFSSSLDKVMNSTGDSKRWIVCETAGAETRYKLPEEKKADRPVGHRESKIPLTIPSVVNNLPQDCHVNIRIEYSVYNFRSFVETVDSNTFKIVPLSEVPANQPQNVPTAVQTEIKPSEARNLTVQPIASQTVQPAVQQTPTPTPIIETQPEDTTVKPPIEERKNLTVLGIPVCVPITGICVTTKG